MVTLPGPVTELPLVIVIQELLLVAVHEQLIGAMILKLAVPPVAAKLPVPPDNVYEQVVGAGGVAITTP